MTKSNFKLKIFFLINIFLLCLIAVLSSEASNTKNNLIVLGSDKAPVKIKIFSSFTCPHCANFHFKVIPEIKREYVDRGKVQLIFIDFPLDQAAFNASKLLHCVDKNKQINFMDTIYKNQNKWTAGKNIDEINNNLKNIVKDLGVNSTGFDNCLNNETIADKILNERINGHKKYSIESTPTIVINEKKLDGSVNFKNIEKKIKKII